MNSDEMAIVILRRVQNAISEGVLYPK